MEMVLSASEEEQVRTILQRMQAGPLHLLVIGGGGCGKSFLCNYFADHFQSVRVSGSDLQALGLSSAVPLLMSLGGGKGGVLVIDDADALMRPPSHLRALLEVTRMSVILSCGISVEEVDPALMDR